MPWGDIESTVSLVRAREVSAMSLTERALDAAEEIGSELNAFATVMREAALRDARRIDAARGDAGPLAGVPFAVKDVFLTTDAPTRAGSSHWEAPPASEDSPLVASLRQAGAILVGKTTMNQFGWGLDPTVGSVENPVLRGRVSGGSSSGSAAAVAAGIVPFALGTDGGGSIRMPASFCGLAGLKPSRGRLPRGGTAPGGRTLVEAGPLATCMADVRSVLAVMLGAERSGHESPIEAPALGILEGSLEGCSPAVQQAVARAIEVLAPQRTVPLDLSEAPPRWYTVFSAEAAEALIGVVGQVSPDLERLLAEGAHVLKDDYAAALRYADELAAVVDAALAGLDALVAPTAPSTAPADDPEWNDSDFFGDMVWLAPFNLTGHPALTLPIPWAPEPVGLQLIGRRGDDERLLAVAAGVEQLLGHNTRRDAGDA